MVPTACHGEELLSLAPAAPGHVSRKSRMREMPWSGFPDLGVSILDLLKCTGHQSRKPHHMPACWVGKSTPALAAAGMDVADACRHEPVDAGPRGAFKRLLRCCLVAFPCSPDEGHNNCEADRCSHACRLSPVTTLAAVEHALFNPVVPSS